MSHLLFYGGTFDPIHHGHLITCRAAREMLGADQVLLVPARVSPHKQGEAAGASPEQRLEMIRRAIEGQGDFAVDAREFNRQGASYTIDTILEIKRERPADRITLLLGADQLPKLHTWHRVENLLAEVTFALLGRPGSDLEAGLAAVAQHLGDAVAGRLRQSLVATPLIDISATQVRQRIARGLPISFLVPEAVAAYISDQRLYQHVSK